MSDEAGGLRCQSAALLQCLYSMFRYSSDSSWCLDRRNVPSLFSFWKFSFFLTSNSVIFFRSCFFHLFVVWVESALGNSTKQHGFNSWSISTTQVAKKWKKKKKEWSLFAFQFPKAFFFIQNKKKRSPDLLDVFASISIATISTNLDTGVALSGTLTLDK